MTIDHTGFPRKPISATEQKRRERAGKSIEDVNLPPVSMPEGGPKATSLRTGRDELFVRYLDHKGDDIPPPGGGVPRERITSASGGQKESKLARFDQIPTFPLHALAEHYGAGNAKYPTAAGEKDNWRKGYAWSLSYAAMQRHANAFWSGEDIDAETGHSHLTAIAWHAFTLLEFTRTHPDYDDRQNGLG